MIVVRDREAGNIIERVKSYDEGEEVISRFETSDKAEGIYEEDFYEVAEVNSLQVIRQFKGLSQSQLAERSGVNVRLIQAYEQGQKDISKASVERVLKLADALDCGVRELIS